MSMIQVKENQLKLPLYPEWDTENKWKTNEIHSIDLTCTNNLGTTFSMNEIPNNIVFSVLGKDMVVIDEDGINRMIMHIDLICIKFMKFMKLINFKLNHSNFDHHHCVKYEGSTNGRKGSRIVVESSEL